MCGNSNGKVDKGGVSFWDIEWAATPWRRMRGLAFGRQRASILVLLPCNDVHTFGMRRPIDVAFVDRRGVVIRSYRSVEAGRRLKCASAYATIERYCDDAAWWPREGDALSIVCSSFEESERMT